MSQSKSFIRFCGKRGREKRSTSRLNEIDMSFSFESSHCSRVSSYRFQRGRWEEEMWSVIRENSSYDLRKQLFIRNRIEQIWWRQL